LLELREREMRKKCVWCDEYLPNSERYHLKICPRCRKEAIGAALEGKEYLPRNFQQRAREMEASAKLRL